MTEPSLTDFLLARITEDERDAPAFAHLYIAHETLETRMLAECKAKRRIVEKATQEGDDWPLVVLATPYAAHPDYRPEWKP